MFIHIHTLYSSQSFPAAMVLFLHQRQDENKASMKEARPLGPTGEAWRSAWHNGCPICALLKHKVSAPTLLTLYVYIYIYVLLIKCHSPIPGLRACKRSLWDVGYLPQWIPCRVENCCSTTSRSRHRSEPPCLPSAKICGTGPGTGRKVSG